MTEPDVTLTDYAVALMCLAFLILIRREPGRPSGLRFWFTIFFASVGAASFIGGTVHGFFVDEQTTGHAILWRLTLLTVGLTTLSMWATGARLLFSPQTARWVLIAATVLLALYSATVLFVTQEFWVAILDYLPAVIFLLVALGLAYMRDRHKSLLLAAGGLALTLVASVLQQSQVGIHTAYFNHNALFHLLQAVALFLLFLGARRLAVAEGSALPKTSSDVGPSTLPI